MARGRPKKPSQEMRDRIIDAARRIISDEGVDALSMRRVTKEIGYSVGIIYHYFENKEQLLACVLQKGYARIRDAVEPSANTLSPDEMIRSAIINYVKSSLAWASEYRAIMFSSSPQVLAFTSVLGEGISDARPALKRLVNTLESGIAQGLFSPCDTEQTAQVIWSSMFGLLARLMIEQDVPPQQWEKLLHRQIDILMKGLRP